MDWIICLPLPLILTQNSSFNVQPQISFVGERRTPEKTLFKDAPVTGRHLPLDGWGCKSTSKMQKERRVRRQHLHAYD